MSDFSILSSFLRSKHGTPAWQAGGAQTATISKSSEKAERGKMGKTHKEKAGMCDSVSTRATYVHLGWPPRRAEIFSAS